MKRVKRRNLITEFTKEDIENLIEDLVKCGYHRDKLKQLLEKLGQADKSKGEPGSMLIPCTRGALFQRTRSTQEFLKVP